MQRYRFQALNLRDISRRAISCCALFASSFEWECFPVLTDVESRRLQDSINTLKRVVAERTGIDADHIRVLFKGRSLGATQSLADW